jgi:dTDP-glucose pyrophosphorylase
MSLFVIPMAGLSSRFFKAGYQQPKYQLRLDQQSIFEWSVRSFEAYFTTDQFIFIMRDVYDAPTFVSQMIKKLGIQHARIVILPHDTQGQADTVYQGLQHTHYDDDLIIFNIDSKRHHYKKPDWYQSCDGYLEVFYDRGEHWSFIEPAPDQQHVIRTTEKQKISDYCSNGLYTFKYRKDFDDIFNFAQNKKITHQGELYIAPLYNQLISAGKKIRYELVSPHQIEFCGTPDEYHQLVRLYGEIL